MSKKKKKYNRGETVKRNPNSLEQNKLLHFRSRIRSLEAVMNDRITIPALNELNSHETRRNRVPNPRCTIPKSKPTDRFTRKSPLLTLILPRCSPPRNHVSSSSSTVSGLLLFNLANGLDSNAVSRFLESLFRAEGEGEGGGGGPRLEKGNADESNEEELKGDRVDSGPRRLARLVRYFNGSSNLRYFVGRDRRWRATRVFIMRC